MSSVAAPRVQWRWILDRRSDLTWYIGSAAVGWTYLLLVLWLGRGLADPLNDPLATVPVGPWLVPITLKLLVVVSWGYLLDAPHLFATLARTYLDPAEWEIRRAPLLRSWGFFLLGPVVVLSPYVLGTIVPLPRWALGLGSIAFTVFFQLWAYFHVVQQHWGFLRLYQRKHGLEDPLELRVDRGFFLASMYLPLVRFMTAPWYAETPFPPLGLQAPILGGRSVADVLHPVATALYAACVVGYVGFQLQLKGPRNGSKLLFLASIAPLHGVVFSHPLLVSFVLPIVTVGHNLQYHRIVWMYGQRRYAADPTQPPVLRKVFSSLWLYGLLGLAFTFALYHGPWVIWASEEAALHLDKWAFHGLAAVAGAENPTQRELGAEIVQWFVMGWAMQHYYLDARIWRVSQDKTVHDTLKV
jgi:hypothetical protein